MNFTAIIFSFDMYYLFTYKWRIHKLSEENMLALNMLSEGGTGPDTSLSLLLFIGIAFFFLIITVGWLSSNRKQDQAEEAHEAQTIPQVGKSESKSK